MGVMYMPNHDARTFVKDYIEQREKEEAPCGAAPGGEERQMN